MKQLIRNKTFETNSSSTHILVLLKHSDDLSEMGMEAHIPIMDNFQGFTRDPEEIMSYLYTIGLLAHNWHLVDSLKREFPLCIFQKPQWDLPYESETGFCDDREVTSFCELINSSMCCYFSDDDINTIIAHLKDFIFKGELFVMWDGDYLHCIPEHHNIDPNDSNAWKIWVEENVDIVIGE